MIYMFSHKDKEAIIGALKENVTSRKNSEKIFNEYRVTDTYQKITSLQECNNTQNFYTPNYHQISKKNKYSFELEVFNDQT